MFTNKIIDLIIVIGSFLLLSIIAYYTPSVTGEY